MPHQPRDHVLGLSAKARRLVYPLAAVTVVVIVVGTLATRGSAAEDGPRVGGDLHAVGEVGDRLFAAGHNGAGYRATSGAWTQIDALDDKDVMAWTQAGASLLAGGHGGLYRSLDNGSTFDVVRDLPVSDVHAVGAVGERVYVASPELGVVVSDDGGTTFESASAAGLDFMGTIWVDPSNPDVAVAPSMQSGVVKTTDGGATWASMGTSSGSMAAAVDASGQRMVTIGMDGSESSNDSGATWTLLEVPAGASAATYTSGGELVVAVLSGERAQLYTSVNGEWDLLT
jgi:hypothetical protein